MIRNQEQFFTRKASLFWRGIAILMVMLSHYVCWYAHWIPSETLRFTMTKWGEYGVDIFFLLSGYGLVKSVRQDKPGLSFIKKRWQNTYLPYLVIAGVISLWDGQLQDMDGWLDFLTGKDYWFIRNILLFYMAFFLIFRGTKKAALRFWLLLSAIAGYSGLLFYTGKQPFWYISNLAFVLGAALALWETKLLSVFKKYAPAQVLFLTVCMLGAVFVGIHYRQQQMGLLWDAAYGFCANVIWMLLITGLAQLFQGRAAVLCFMGNISLELYLLHHFLYDKIVNSVRLGEVTVFILTVAATFGLAFGIHRILGWWTGRRLFGR